MSTIYLICGIIGWGVCPFAFLAYGLAGARRRRMRGFEVAARRED